MLSQVTGVAFCILDIVINTWCMLSLVLAVIIDKFCEDIEDEDDTLRDGEFVCRSCFMAKRESALADPEAMLCRDCA